MEAVIGVVGFIFGPFLGGGVTIPLLEAAETSANAAIFDVVGVLNGKRFNGGSLKGWSVLRLIFAPLGFRSVCGSMSFRGFLIVRTSVAAFGVSPSG